MDAVLVEHPVARLFQGRVTDVRAQHHPVHGVAQLGKDIVGQHGQAIDFLAGRAPHRPQAQRCRARGVAGPDVFPPRQAQRVERRRIAQPFGHADGQRLQQRLHELGVVLRVLGELGQAGRAMLAHHALELAAQRGFLVLAQIQARAAAQALDQCVKGRPLARHVGRAVHGHGAVDPVTQAPAQRHGAGDVVCQSPVDQGLRHAGKRGLAGLFGPDRATGFAHDARAHRPVLARAGQNDGQRMPPERPRGGAEQAVQRGHGRRAGLGGIQPQHAAVDFDVVPRRGDVQQAAAQGHAVCDGLNGDARDRLQQPHQGRRFATGEVLGHDGRHARVVRHRGHQLAQRLQSSGGSADQGDKARRRCIQLVIPSTGSL